MAFVPRSRMDPPPPELPPMRHDCIMVPIRLRSTEDKFMARSRRQWRAPSDHHPECKRLQNPARRLWAPQPTKKIDISIGTSPHAAPPVAQSHPLTPKAPYKSAQDDSG